MLSVLVENIFYVLMGILILVVGFIIYKQHLMIEKLASSKQSLATKYGKISEQFLPFMENYPYEKSKFRFIGNPIDGIQFEDDKVVFVEFKTGKSRMTSRQKSICELVNKGSVEFREFRI